ncbi:MAG: hypothetical protein QE271_05825 [Bacteriovoracaceae bacterium]|nr:hypothetical protein [Bacteriovoracaceae bacterium]
MILNKLFFLVLLFTFQMADAADVKKLTSLFEKIYNTHYTPVLCGKNIQKFLALAEQAGIDLNNSEVWNVKGNGHFETSGFHTRSSTTRRSMLGFFHVILYADGHIFDFDLQGPHVLNTYQYARLMFTPPSNPFPVGSVRHDFHKDLKGWTIEAFDAKDHIQNIQTSLWKRKFMDVISLEKLFSIDRTTILK